MKRLVTAILTTLILLPVAAMSQDITFGAMPLPPFVYEENGQATGSDVEIVREVCKHMGVKPDIQIMPFVRLLDAAKKGTLDGNFPIYHTKEREAFLSYSPEPHNVRRMVIIARKDSEMSISGLDDIKDKTIAVVSGYAYGAAFDNHPGLKKEACKTDEELLTMLIKGRRDLAATEETVAIHTGKKLGYQDQFEVVYVLSEDPLYVTFSKAAGPRSESLAKAFGESLRQLKEKGVIQQIIARYH